MGVKRYFVLIGLVFFVLILMSFDLETVFSIIMRADPYLLLLAVGLSVFTGLFKGWKWQLILKAEGLDFSLLKCTKVFFIAFFLSLLTPGRVGEVVRTVYFKGTRPEKVLPSVVVDRAFDLAILFGLTIVAALSFTYFFGKEVVPLYVIALAGLLLVAAVFLVSRQNLLRRIMRVFYNFLVPQRFKARAKLTFDSFYDSLRRYRQSKALILGSVALALVAWFISIVSAYILLPALGIQEIPFYYIFLVLPIITLVALIPISITGLGTREAAVILLFAVYGVSVEQSIAFSIVFLFAGYIAAAVIGFVLFTLNPVDLKVLKGWEQSPEEF